MGPTVGMGVGATVATAGSVAGTALDDWLGRATGATDPV
jgi:hypothetical protein